ncbi:hypothetical protein C8F04DRAFT_1144344 [Mycena alexandri]|uniref:Uncharacterized protein n=1 Tax=Mycena alexandri TaxID=1745969 RepID=A0AAD6S3H0_9AGAR|nr:hypothetical protein C8F04DRAFT_1144344 [Mycena alexandri]
MARTNDGTSLVSGIQDISAFLPIIGTDQCERHVGEALEGGYLYAAAAPLSMFGSLGIVKASTAILVASLSPGSAQMLVNAGFKLEGSVAAMLGTAPCPTVNISARCSSTPGSNSPTPGSNSKALLAETPRRTQIMTRRHSRQNILLPRSCEHSSRSSTSTSRSRRDSNPPPPSFPAWAPPILRIAGSAISVIVAQMVIQGKIQQALQSMLDGTE